MRSKEKCVFIFHYGKVGEEFRKELQKRLGVIVTENYCYAGYAVYVDKTAYARALRIGTKLMISNQAYMQYGDWVDYYNGLQVANRGLIMYGFLPKNRKVNKFWADEDIPRDIFEFKTELSEFLGKKVYVSSNTADNAINVHVEGLNEHKTIKRDVKKFLKDHETPFEKIMFFNYVGKLIQ